MVACSCCSIVAVEEVAVEVPVGDVGATAWGVGGCCCWTLSSLLRRRLLVASFISSSGCSDLWVTSEQCVASDLWVASAKLVSGSVTEAGMLLCSVIERFMGKY